MKFEDVQRDGDLSITLGCQYLYNSAQCMLRALTEYNSPQYGDVERSFTDFFKAWDSLWIADVTSKNLSFISAKHEELYRLFREQHLLSSQAYAAKLAKAKKVKSNTFSLAEVYSSLNNMDINKQGQKLDDDFSGRSVVKEHKSDEKELVRIAGWLDPQASPFIQRDSQGKEFITLFPNTNNKAYRYKLVPDNNQQTGIMFYRYGNDGLTNRLMQLGSNNVLYSNVRAAPIFREITQKDSPIRTNVFLFKELRNLNQHDFLELEHGTHSSMVKIMNPFVIACVINYMDGYRQVLKDVQAQCGTHTSKRKSGYCVASHIVPFSTLQDVVRFPRTLEETIGTNYDEFDLGFLRTFSKGKKSIRKLLIESIDRVEETLSIQKQNSPKYRFPGENSLKHELNLSAYKYATLAAVSNQLNAEGIQTTPHKVQNFKEHVIETATDSNSSTEEFFIEVLGKHIYSDKFKNEASKWNRI